MSAKGNLELAVTNFGPIAEAQIDLRPLTVFVGPSNTGKSYMAILIYALHRFFSPYTGLAGVIRHQYWRRESDSPIARHASAEHMRALTDWLDSMSVYIEKLKDSDDFSICVPDMIRPLTQIALENTSGLGDNFEEEMSRCFGMADAGTLIRYGSDDEAKIRLRRRLTTADRTSDIEYKFTVNPVNPSLVVSIPTDIPFYVEGTINRDIREILGESTWMRTHRILFDEGMDEDKRWRIASNIVEFIQLIESAVLNPLGSRAHYLPADRTGVMHAHRVAVGSLIAQAPYAGFQRNDQFPALSGVLADFLGELTDMGELQNPMIPPWVRRFARETRGGNSTLAEGLESKLLGGTVNNRPSSIGYPMFFFQPDGWARDLPLMNASSMISELAPVVLYLRRVVSPGEVLIIEEPESHLHPALQVEFVRHIAAMVHAGVRVMLTTHSEWVLDELINLVRLSELPPDERPRVGGADYAISHEQLGMWRFDSGEDGQGSTVMEIPYDDEIGNFRSGFSEVVEDTYNDFAHISNRISNLARKKKSEKSN